MMEFVYRYYYTCFYLHRKTKGRPPEFAWARALVQVSAGILFFVFGLILSVAILLDKTESIKGGNGLLVGLTALIPMHGLRYLLFNIYEVSYESGRTPRSDFEVTVGWKRFFWCSWLVAVTFPLIAGLYANGYSWHNLQDIPWSV